MFSVAALNCQSMLETYRQEKKTEDFLMVMHNEHLLLEFISREVYRIYVNIERIKHETRLPEQVCDRLRKVLEEAYQKLTDGIHDRTKGPEYFYKILLKLHQEVHVSEEEFDLLFK